MSVILHFKVLVYAVGEPRWTRSLLLLHFPPVGAHFRPSEPRHLQDERTRPLTIVIFKNKEVLKFNEATSATSTTHVQVDFTPSLRGPAESLFLQVARRAASRCLFALASLIAVLLHRLKKAQVFGGGRGILSQVQRPPLIITFCIFMFYRLTTRSS